jgi:hypothetical protein
MPALGTDCSSDQLSLLIEPTPRGIGVVENVNVLSKLSLEPGRSIIEEFTLLRFVKHARLSEPLLSRRLRERQLRDEYCFVESEVAL